MNKLIAFLSCVLLVCTLVSCSDDDNETNQPLALSANSIEIPYLEKDTIVITQGSGDYSIVSEKDSIATAVIEGATVIITAHKEGFSEIIVTDNRTNKQQTITTEVLNYYVGAIVEVAIGVIGDIDEELKIQLIEKYQDSHPHPLPVDARYWFLANTLENPNNLWPWFAPNGTLRAYPKGNGKEYYSGTFEANADYFPYGRGESLILNYNNQKLTYEYAGSLTSEAWGGLGGLNFYFTETIETTNSYKVIRGQKVVMWPKDWNPNQ